MHNSKNTGDILVLGARGMLGRDLTKILRDEPWFSQFAKPTVYAWDIDELDITSADRVEEAMQKLQPSVVINCAAYTDVDGCESKREIAMAVNAAAPGHIAVACRNVGARMTHVSTDYVFNGCGERPYQPGDAAEPINVYGESKWAGEQAIRGALKEHVIVRTSWLFGSEGKNFVKTIRSLAGQREYLDVVNDQVGCPTYTADLAEGIIRLILAGVSGTFHFHNAGQCSWYEFAKEIVRQSGLKCEIRPTTSDKYVRPARRPTYSVLDMSSYEQATGHSPQGWIEALAAYLHVDRV